MTSLSLLLILTICFFESTERVRTGHVSEARRWSRQSFGTGSSMGVKWGISSSGGVLREVDEAAHGRREFAGTSLVQGGRPSR